MTTSNNEFAALLGEVFDNSTAENLKAPANDNNEQETCPCKKKLKALSKKLKLNAIRDKLGKCCDK